tara:strand:- start:6 stop:797 length:792 start_codon:yes stop_codon:yes gene_type:complete
MQKIFILLIGIFFANVSQAQNHKNVPSINDCVGKNFSVAVWVLEDTMGLANITQANVQLAINDLNASFGDICVTFNLCKYTVLPNARQSKVNVNQEDKEIATIHQVKNVINLYFVEEVIGDPSLTLAQLGDTILPDLNDPLTNAIFITKSTATDGATINYALGRFFGLNYTSFIGDELADASNCSTAGDKICDTPADPGGTADGACHLSYDAISPALDANGHYYVPDVCNFMSWYSPLCRASFTIEQYNKMAEVILKGRNYLW